MHLGNVQDLRRVCRRRAFILLLSLLLAALPCLAGQLTADVRLLTLTVSARAPMPAEIRFRWDGATLLEGRLAIDIVDGNDVLSRFESADLAIATGQQTFRLLLPPLARPTYSSMASARLRFLTQSAVIDLGAPVLRAREGPGESLILAMCDPHNQPSAEALKLDEMLQLTAPGDMQHGVRRNDLTTWTHRLKPDDLPVQPLAYCGYDMVCLAEGALEQVRERQAEALLAWVRAGGSLFVLVGGPLQPYHITFLDRLVDLPGATPAFSQVEGQTVLTPATELQAQGGVRGILTCRTGVGRSVLVTDPRRVSALPDPGVWTQPRLFLWKVRVDQYAAVGAANASSNLSSSRAYNDSRFYDPRAAEIPSRLMNTLLRGRIQPIPFGLLVLLLGLFVVVIGPVDYVGLGVLKRRKYTWILFPLVTAGFTFLMVELANRYLGRNDIRRSFVVVDVDRDGAPLRRQAFELVFAGRNKTTTTAYRNSLWAPVRDVQGAYYRYGGAAVDPDNAARNVLYRGAFPGRFEVVQSLRQWQPRLGHVFALEAPPPPVPIRWAAVDAAFLDKNPASAVRDRLFGKAEPTAAVFVFGRNGLKDQSLIEPAIVDPDLVRWCCMAGSRLWDSSTPPTPLAQHSPTGGSGFDDLPLFDPSDPATRMVVVALPQEDDIHLYRRLYHAD